MTKETLSCLQLAEMKKKSNTTSSVDNNYNHINNILGQILEMNNQLSRNLERRRKGNESLEVFNSSSLEDEKDRQLLSSLEEFGPTKNQEDKL